MKWKIILIIGMVILMSSTVSAPEFSDTSDDNFSGGTLFQTNISNGGISSNVTLNYTITNAGSIFYNTTGNYTSQIFDTGNPNSVFDKIQWEIELANSSDILCFTADDGNRAAHIFYRNGSIGINLSNRLTENMDFTNNLNRFTIPSDVSIDDVLSCGFDGDNSNIHMLLLNGTVLQDLTAGLNQNYTFADYSTYDISTANKSQIVGFVVDIDPATEGGAILLNNGTYLTDSDINNGMSFTNFRKYTLTGNTYNKVIGALYDRLNDEMAIFLNNGTFLADLTESSLETVPAFTTPYNAITIHNSINLTTSSNITFFTHVGNTTPITNLFGLEYSNNTFNSDVNRNNNVGRYIQYKAVLKTPDRYKTPNLENATINYTQGVSTPEANGGSLRNILFGTGHLKIGSSRMRIS